MKAKVNWKLFAPAMALLLAMIVLIAVNMNFVQQTMGKIYDFCISRFGWLFVVTNIVCLVFSLWIMFGPYKNVRLGGENSKPAFSTLAWAGMMFTTSCGAWLVVYGFLEPIYCAAQAPFQIEPLTTKAYEYGQMYAHFHWGPNAWCIYVPISVAIGYLLYNRGAKTGTVGTVCQNVLPGRGGRAVSYCADVVSVCSSVIAPVISIGTGMPLLVVLLERIFNIPDIYRSTLQILILSTWVAIFGTSVYLGLQKGIKNLSNANITIAFVYMLIFGVAVGVFKILAAEVNTVGLFINNFLRMTTYTDPYGTGSFVKGWTMSYWAVYFVYMPLMGVFNAKISKGRRLKDIAFGQLVLCTLGCWVAMATFGNYSMKLQVDGILDISSYLQTGDEAGAILAILETMPMPQIMMICLLIISFVFLATTMDSSAFAAAEMTAKQGDSSGLAPRWLRIVWAAVASVIAYVVLQLGGVKAVRSLCYIAGLPLAILTYPIVVATVKMLRQDHEKKAAINTNNSEESENV